MGVYSPINITVQIGYEFQTLFKANFQIDIPDEWTGGSISLNV